MAGGLPHRAGVLVVRVWHEEGAAEDELRARVIHMADPDGAEPVEEVVASRDEILAVVSKWLDELRAQPD
jgi:hypothetical protein